jgi:hypothetical protein
MSYKTLLWLSICVATNALTFMYCMNEVKAAKVNMQLIRNIMDSREFKLGPLSVEYKCFSVDKN